MKLLFLLSLVGYIFLLWLTSYSIAKRARSSEAYLVASRNLPIPLVSVLIAGTWMGGVAIVGMAQGAYLHGISALWFQIGIWLAMIASSLLLEKILRNGETFSILDVVAGLYDRRTARIAGVMQLIFLVWCVTMQIAGGGAVLSYVFREQITFNQAMALTALVFVLYNTIGGFVATAYTNLIHVAAIIIGLFSGGLYVFFNSRILGNLPPYDHYFTPFGDLGALQALSWCFINFTLGILAQPVITTASSARSIRDGKIGILAGNFISIPVVMLAALCGIMAKALFPQIPSLSALPSLLSLVPPYIGVFFLISMWAPLLSCGSPFLMGATALVVKGFIAPLIKSGGDRRLLYLSKMTTFMLGLISLLLGFFVKEILREVTWIGVLLSATVYIVFFGWVKKIEGIYPTVSLIGSSFLLFFFFLTGLHKVLHPVWPVTVFVLGVMALGLLSKRKG
ncbi:MAG: hypothetical protein N2745_08940 [Syntrophorhabdaceae bacterium]|nr:hypothetical protein [Syntrophorhabdaceae bacterium]